MNRDTILTKAKPILFNTDMVRAILDRRKTATRRVVKNADSEWSFCSLDNDPWEIKVKSDGEEYPSKLEGLYATFSDVDFYPMIKAPYQPGDILYVRETFAKIIGTKYIYKANTSSGTELLAKRHGGWRPSIHMPKEAARIFLRVKDVRVERLRDMTEESAMADGFPSRAAAIEAILTMYPNCTEDSWFWVISFERIIPG